MTAKILNFGDWKTVLQLTFSMFPRVWCGIAVVNIFVAFVILAWTAILAGIGLWAVGGMSQFENLIASLTLGGVPDAKNLIVALIIAVLLAVFCIVFVLVGKITSLIVIKNSIDREELKNPIGLFFSQGWRYFFRYFWLGIRIFWYVSWILLALVGVAAVAANFFPEAMLAMPFAGAVGVVFMIRRAVLMVFAGSALVHFDKSAGEAMQISRNLALERWWRVVFSLFGVWAVVFVIKFLLGIPDFLANFGLDFSMANLMAYFSGSGGYSPTFWVTLEWLFSFFVVAPFFVSFVYFLMLFLVKKTSDS